MRILLIEDDLDMSAAISRALSRRGFQITLCLDGHTALSKIREQRSDAIVLDLGIPGLDGLHVLHRTRTLNIHTPILVLTARGAVGDRISGLNAGADDYLGKPFDLGELEARLRALGRRGMQANEHIRCGRLRMDPDTGAFFGDDAPLDLGPREAGVLRALMDRPGQAVSKSALFNQAYPGDTQAQTEFVEVIVHRLRKKLQPHGVEIVTLRGLGYLLRAVR
ncbi:response regulator transcription factor [Orrella sp. JC864]|uniref:response regulator n=1 Tax=Orrella sp. JC864 TaxID=3120298 RepID=UPI0012BC80CA